MRGRSELRRSPLASIQRLRLELEDLGRIMAHKLPKASPSDVIRMDVITLFATDMERSAIDRLTPATVLQSVARGFHAARDEQDDAASLLETVIPPDPGPDWSQLPLWDEP